LISWFVIQLNFAILICTLIVIVPTANHGNIVTVLTDYHELDKEVVLYIDNIASHKSCHLVQTFMKQV